MFSLFRKKPTTSSAFSEFMRNASAREQKRVFKKVIEDSIKAQQATIDRADRLIAEEEKGSRSSVARQEQATDNASI